MKKALLAALVTGISITEFEDGSRIGKVSLEDGYSFNVPETSPILKKVTAGFELDLTYNGDKSNTTTTASGSSFTFHNLSGVKLMAVREGEIDGVIADLPDTGATVPVKKVGAGATTGGTAGAPAKV